MSYFVTTELGHEVPLGDWRALQHTDGVWFTHYRYFPDPGPDPIIDELRDLRDAFPGRILAAQEFGFYTPAGYEQKMEEALRELFAAWDSLGLNLPYLGFFGLHDWYEAPRSCWKSCRPRRRMSDATASRRWTSTRRSA
jgi:hypothetical protein